jgi:signal transduction histidine kinase
MAADVTIQARSDQAGATQAVRRRSFTFGLSWRILALVVAAVMTAEIAIFLPSIARFRTVYLNQLIESGTLAALALDATPDNMVTEEVKRTLLDHARVDAVVLVEPNKPKRALLNIEPKPSMPTFNLKEEGALMLIWDALQAMANDGQRYIRVGGQSMRLPNAMVWIVADELPMRIAMYGYASRILVLSIIIALFTAFLLYLALRWLVILPLQGLSADMVAFRRAPEEPGTERQPTKRRDEIGVVDREFQNLQRELRASLRQKSRLAEVGAATNKINHDLRNMLSTARLLSDRLARSEDERTRALAPTILNTIDRAARLASDAIEYVRDQRTPRLAAIDLADLVDEVGVALQEQGEESNPNIVRGWINEVAHNQPARADRDLLYRVFVNLGRNAFEAGATAVTVRARRDGGNLLVDVCDNGPGIAHELADDIFRPFVSGGRPGGAGLGLAIARDLVRAHGGDITVAETGQQGTTFRFTLPLSRLQLRNELADAFRVHAEVGLAVAALGADVDLAAGAVGPDADDDVVAEAKPDAGCDRFDAAVSRGAGDDIPAHRRRHGIDLLERLGRRDGQDDRRDVGVGGALQYRCICTGIGRRVGGAAAQLQGHHQRRRAGGVGRDVVEFGRLLGMQEPGERHVGGGAADHDGEQRRHEATPAIDGPRRHDGGKAQRRAGHGEIEAVTEDREGRLDLEPGEAMQWPRRRDDQRRNARHDEGHACQTMTDRVGRTNEHGVAHRSRETTDTHGSTSAVSLSKRRL